MVSDFKLFLLSRQRWPESLQGKQEQEERELSHLAPALLAALPVSWGAALGPVGTRPCTGYSQAAAAVWVFVLQTYTTACVVL